MIRVLRWLGTSLALSLCLGIAAAEEDGSGMSLEAFQQRRAAIAYQFLNDLSSRRRVTTFFPNQQSPLYGAQDGFLNTTRGNVTFVIRDLVRVAAMPIVVARVYDSSGGIGDFGRGWSLGPAERIEARQGQLRLIDASNTTHELDRRGQEVKARYPAITPIDSGQRDGHRIILRAGDLVREFERRGQDFLLVRALNGQGGSVEITYARDRISRIDSGNAFVEFQRDGRGRITAIRDDVGREVHYAYQQGNLVSVRDLGGEDWQFSYTNALSSVVDPRGSTVFQATYAAAGRAATVRVMRAELTATYAQGVTELTDSLGRTTRFEHDASGLTTAVTDAQGHRTSIVHDEHFRLIKVRANGQLTARLRYNADNNVQRIRSGGQTFDYRYDRRDRLVSRSSSDGTTAFAYDGTTERVVAVDSATLPRQYGYSARGQLRIISNPQSVLAIDSNRAGLTRSVDRDGERLLSFTYRGIRRRDRVDRV